MADTFKNVENKSNPSDRWFAITPGATAFDIVPRAIICTADGSVTMEDAAGTEMTVSLTAGTVIPVRPTKVTAAVGTVFGLY